MSSLALLLFSSMLKQHPISAESVLMRYGAYRKAHPCIEATWVVTRDKEKLADGKILIDGTRRFKSETHGEGTTYILGETERGGVELVPEEGMYDEFEPQRRIVEPDSRVSDLSSYLPAILLRPTIADASGKLAFHYLGVETIEGDSVDRVGWTLSGQQGSIDYEVAIDAAGRVRRFEHSLAHSFGQGPARMPNAGKPLPMKSGTAKIPLGSSEGPSFNADGIVWTISNWRPRKPVLSEFLVAIPNGYVPYALPNSSEIALEVDKPLPKIAWTRNGKQVSGQSIFAGTPGLLIVTAPDCEPSQRLLAALPSFRKDFDDSKLVIERASVARSVKGSDGTLYDPTGKAAKAFGAAATPFIVLVDAKGKVTNLWTGFDPAAASDLKREILKALQAQAKS